MKKTKAIWFSRHLPTSEQSEQIDILLIEEGLALGSRNIATQEDAAEVAASLRALALEAGVNAVAGVFPTALLAEAWRNALFAVRRGDFSPGAIGLLASVNEARSPEGGKPTFRHLRWEEVGVI